MKRHFTLLLTIFTILLAACGSGGGSSSGSSSGTSGGAQQGLSGATSFIDCPANTNTTAAAPESGTITLTVSGFSSSPAEDALVKANLDKFTQAHPNIKLNWAPITGDYAVKMRANVASGTVPDVFYLSPAMSSEFITNGKALNLSPYMAKDNVPASDYYPALLSPFSCKNGQVFGLPKDWNSLGVFYNKTMFQAAGLQFPGANWTWDDMLTDAKKLTHDTNNPAKVVYGITLPADASRWAAFLFAAGGSVLNRDGTQAAFDNQAGIDSLKFYASFQKQHAGALPTQVGAGWAGDAFGKQKAAMALEGGWLIPYMTSTFPNVQYDIAPVPVDSATGKRADLIYTNAWSAYSGTKHPEAAWELIRYMTGKDVQESQLNAGFALPTLKSLANAPYFTQHPGFKVLFDAANYSYADYYGPKDTIIHDRLQKAIEKVLLGKADEQTALKDAAAQVNNELGA